MDDDKANGPGLFSGDKVAQVKHGTDRDPEGGDICLVGSLGAVEFQIRFLTKGKDAMGKKGDRWFEKIIKSTPGMRCATQKFCIHIIITKNDSFDITGA